MIKYYCTIIVYSTSETMLSIFINQGCNPCMAMFTRTIYLNI